MNNASWSSSAFKLLDAHEIGLTVGTCHRKNATQEPRMEYIITAVCTTPPELTEPQAEYRGAERLAHSPSDRPRPRRVLVDPRDNPEQHEISV